MVSIMSENVVEFCLIVLSLHVFVEGFDATEKSSQPSCVDSVCKKVSDCEFVLRNIRNSAPNLCGWAGRTPLVCCPVPVTVTRSSESECARTNEQDFPGRQVRPLLPFPGAQPASLTPKPLIVGGRDSLSDSRPWMVALLDKGPGNVLARFFCGGSLIGARYLLTAAHCFIGRALDTRQFEILMGNNNLELASRHDVDKITLHRGFSDSIWYNDIAIIRLQNEVSFSKSIRPICLPPPSARNMKFQSSTTTVAGWGRLKFEGNLSEKLQEVNLPVIPNPQCDNILLSIRGVRARYPSGITDSIICAGSDTPKDACEGDSGGPMFIPDKMTQRWLLIGVVSTGFQCAVPGVPGIYTRVTSYIGWINDNLN